MISLAILPSVTYDVVHEEEQGSTGPRETRRANALSAAELSKIGKQGGKARAAKLTAAQRSEIARKAVQARIAKHGQQKRKGDKA